MLESRSVDQLASACAPRRQPPSRSGQGGRARFAPRRLPRRRERGRERPRWRALATTAPRSRASISWPRPALLVVSRRREAGTSQGGGRALLPCRRGGRVSCPIERPLPWRLVPHHVIRQLMPGWLRLTESVRSGRPVAAHNGEPGRAFSTARRASQIGKVEVWQAEAAGIGPGAGTADCRPG